LRISGAPGYTHPFVSSQSVPSSTRSPALAATAAADDAQNCRLEYLLRAALEV
jgi:hypothetical protein